MPSRPQGAGVVPPSAPAFTFFREAEENLPGKKPNILFLSALEIIIGEIERFGIKFLLIFFNNFLRRKFHWTLAELPAADPMSQEHYRQHPPCPIIGELGVIGPKK